MKGSQCHVKKDTGREHGCVSEFTLVAVRTRESKAGAEGRETPPLCGVCEPPTLEPLVTLAQTQQTSLSCWGGG